MTDYPEHDKMMALKTQADAIGEFIEWLESQDLMIAGPNSYGLARSLRSNDQLIAEHLGVDLDAIEREKRSMLNIYRTPPPAPGSEPAACDECESSGSNCLAHRTVEQRTAAGW